MAQTNFYYKEGAAWVAFTERQVQYLPEYRRIYIIHATPGATQPYISTIVDIAPAKLPEHPLEVGEGVGMGMRDKGAWLRIPWVQPQVKLR